MGNSKKTEKAHRKRISVIQYASAVISVIAAVTELLKAVLG